MGIGLVLKDYCQNCDYFDPDVVKNVIFADGEATTSTMVYCQHKELCESIVKYLKEETYEP